MTSDENGLTWRRVCVPLDFGFWQCCFCSNEQFKIVHFMNVSRKIASKVFQAIKVNRSLKHELSHFSSNIVGNFESFQAFGFIVTWNLIDNTIVPITWINIHLYNMNICMPCSICARMRPIRVISYFNFTLKK